MTGPAEATRSATNEIISQAVELVGGRARLEVTLLLASILGLDAADKAAVSAIASSLKGQFGLNNTDVGLLIAATSIAGAVFTLPIGSLVDRINRKKVLLVAIILWTLATIGSGFVHSFTTLLLVRIVLGGVTAAAAPSVASMVGDFFPAGARARAYGTILSGELVGIGIGFFLSGEISSILNWRWSFYLLAVPSAVVGWLIWRFLPEPARGGQGYLLVGQEELTSETSKSGIAENREEEADESAKAHRRIREAGVKPRRELVLHENPTAWTIWRTMRYVLQIPTYRLVVIASSLGYFFFAGIRAFGMIFLTGHYGLSRSTVSAAVIPVGIGAIAGVMAGGRISGWLFKRGWLDARVIVPGAALLLAALFVAPAVLTGNAVLGFGLLTLAAAALGAANPPLDAARLDIVHPRLWGRAEAGRMALRGALEGIAPILFGWLSGLLGGGSQGLKWTFLIMLAPLIAASALAVPARRSYPADVATADASAQSVSARETHQRSSASRRC